ncbi:MAG: type II toxin-antitoxin system RelE/ParE family toxin [Phycisphaerae bacterium]|jgi:antitoxin ParD1/3/4/toxin ParE1/3/4
MKTFELTAKARDDLFDIWNDIAKTSPDAADRVIHDLEAAMQRAAEFPLLGFRRPDVRERRYRFWVVYSYLIVYLPDTDPLQVIRVVHGRRDVPTVLKE